MFNGHWTIWWFSLSMRAYTVTLVEYVLATKPTKTTFHSYRIRLCLCIACLSPSVCSTLAYVWTWVYICEFSPIACFVCVRVHFYPYLPKFFVWMTLYMRRHSILWPMYGWLGMCVFVWMFLCFIIPFVWRYFVLSLALIQYTEAIQFTTGDREKKKRNKEK